MNPRTETITESLAPMVGADDLTVAKVPPQEMQVGVTYHSRCDYADDGSFDRLSTFTYQPGQLAAVDGAPTAVTPPSADVLAHRAYTELDLPLPAPRTSPPPGTPVLVGVPVQLWLDGSAWTPVEATAGAGGVTVTVTAEPTGLHWDMGDGTSFTCAGPGTSRSDDGPAAAASGGSRTSCRHVYQYISDDEPGGSYTVTATVTWSVTWSASTGESGTLPDTDRSGSIDLEVGQRQSVIE